MGDTIFKEFTENWSEVTGLILDVSYSFQNVNTADLFLQQAPTQPEEGEIGQRLPPAISAVIIKEASAIWVRSKTHKGIAIYNEVPTVSGGGGGSGAFPVVEELTDTLLLEVDDNETYFVMNLGFQQDIFIPENVSQPFPIGAEIVFERKGTGIVMFHDGGVVVLNSKLGLVTINAQFTTAALKKIGTDEWTLFGDLA